MLSKRLFDILYSDILATFVSFDRSFCKQRTMGRPHKYIICDICAYPKLSAHVRSGCAIKMNIHTCVFFKLYIFIYLFSLCIYIDGICTLYVISLYVARFLGFRAGFLSFSLKIWIQENCSLFWFSHILWLYLRKLSSYICTYIPFPYMCSKTVCSRLSVILQIYGSLISLPIILNLPHIYSTSIYIYMMR